MSAMRSAPSPTDVSATVFVPAPDGPERVPIGQLAVRVVAGPARTRRILRGSKREPIEVAAFQSSI